jgi:hypothetical protein
MSDSNGVAKRLRDGLQSAGKAANVANQPTNQSAQHAKAKVKGAGPATVALRPGEHYAKRQ